MHFNIKRNVRKSYTTQCLDRVASGGTLSVWQRDQVDQWLDLLVSTHVSASDVSEAVLVKVLKTLKDYGKRYQPLQLARLLSEVICQLYAKDENLSVHLFGTILIFNHATVQRYEFLCHFLRKLENFPLEKKKEFSQKITIVLSELERHQMMACAFDLDCNLLESESVERSFLKTLIFFGLTPDLKNSSSESFMLCLAKRTWGKDQHSLVAGKWLIYLSNYSLDVVLSENGKRVSHIAAYLIQAALQRNSILYLQFLVRRESSEAIFSSSLLQDAIFSDEDLALWLIERCRPHVVSDLTRALENELRVEPRLSIARKLIQGGANLSQLKYEDFRQEDYIFLNQAGIAWETLLLNVLRATFFSTDTIVTFDMVNRLIQNSRDLNYYEKDKSDSICYYLIFHPLFKPVPQSALDFYARSPWVANQVSDSVISSFYLSASSLQNRKQIQYIKFLPGNIVIATSNDNYFPWRKRQNLNEKHCAYICSVLEGSMRETKECSVVFQELQVLYPLSHDDAELYLVLKCLLLLEISDCPSQISFYFLEKESFETLVGMWSWANYLNIPHLEKVLERLSTNKLRSLPPLSKSQLFELYHFFDPKLGDLMRNDFFNEIVVKLVDQCPCERLLQDDSSDFAKAILAATLCFKGACTIKLDFVNFTSWSVIELASMVIAGKFFSDPLSALWALARLGYVTAEIQKNIGILLTYQETQFSSFAELQAEGLSESCLRKDDYYYATPGDTVLGADGIWVDVGRSIRQTARKTLDQIKIVAQTPALKAGNDQYRGAFFHNDSSRAVLVGARASVEAPAVK